MHALWWVGVVAACGGNEHAIPDAPPRDSEILDAARAIDAQTEIDAPRDASGPDAMQACSIDAAFPGGTLGAPANRLSGNWFYAGEFSMGLSLVVHPDGTRDVLLLDVTPTSGSYATGVAYPNDPDPTATGPVSWAMILGNFDSTTSMYGTVYWATTGETTFTAFGQIAGSTIDGSTTPMSFHQIDDNTGATVPGGCTTSIGTLQFYLLQNQ